MNIPDAGLNSVPYARPRSSTLGHWIIIILLLLVLGMSLIGNVGLLVFCLSAKAITDIGNDRTHRPLAEECVEGGGRKKVVEIDVTGIISFQGEGGFLFEQEDMATRVIREIEQAGDDPNVAAILLMVDSPGGGVTASDIIYEKLVKFKSAGKRSRKIVVLMRDLAASGGYYISAAADKIVAHRTTITGSIGVLISMANFKGLGDKIGVKDVTIKSGKNKDMLNPLRELGTEETNILQAAVNDMYDRFVSVVARGRGMDAAKVREIADGRIYTATQALALNLVDEIGYREDAIAQLKKVTGLAEFKVVKYKTTSSLFNLLSSRIRPPAVVEMPGRWKAQWPQFQYLWQPEL